MLTCHGLRRRKRSDRRLLARIRRHCKRSIRLTNEVIELGNELLPEVDL